MVFRKLLLPGHESRISLILHRPQAVLITTLLLLSSARSTVSQAQSQTCRAVLKGSGVIASPNYPKSYPANISCAWTLESSSSNTTVRLQFIQIDTEPDYDFVQVYDEHNNQYSYTGSRLPPTMMLGRWATVEFKVSGRGRHRRGFSANFTSAEKSLACGGRLSGYGIITSPNYPDAYPNNTTCVWGLRSTSNDTNIKLQFIVFATEKNYDYLHIYDEKGRLTRYSGIVRPPIMTLGRWATLLFTSDGSITQLGFRASFTSFNSTDVLQCKSSDTYWCRNSNKCISSNWRCDGALDCLYGEDETFCSPSTTTTSPERQCTTESRYWCNTTRRCINQSWRCDGTSDCAYGEDESNCYDAGSILCQQRGSYWCSRSRKCIPSKWKCDGASDCSYGEDEAGCSRGGRGRMSKEAISGVVSGSVLGFMAITFATVGVCRCMRRRRAIRGVQLSEIQLRRVRRLSQTASSAPPSYADSTAAQPKPGSSMPPAYEGPPPSYEAVINACSYELPDGQPHSRTATALPSANASAASPRSPPAVPQT